MPSSPSPKAPAATFACGSALRMRSACKGLPFFKEHEGQRYCVLHYPGRDKVAAFREALKKKLDRQDFDFRGVWFPGAVRFGGVAFNRPVHFNSATFSAATYFNSATFNADAYFNSATFSADAYFHSASFEAAARFNSATFDAEAYFKHTTFRAAANFTSATFNSSANFSSAAFHAKADFGSATFRAATNFALTKFGAMTNFKFTTFEDYVRFAGGGERNLFGDDSSLNLQFARVEKPDRLSFHTLRLRPHWFVNVDSRKFEFINVEWSDDISQELDSLHAKSIKPPHKLLGVACRHLALNAEENHHYIQASRFRYWSMDARRRQHSFGFVPWRLSWWYWLASGYGERAWRAFVVLVGVWVLAAALYTQVGFVRWEPRVSSEQEAWAARRDEVGRPLRWQRALTYSLGVMTLQKPEPRPATDAAQAAVMLETILGPVQAALLALAIRRKFMR